ncbi:MAG TPA: rhodanese-like domain-containing protein [Stellaceae bacterium]|nr:rhodanese-like domain-containing protein [Stellaceae bacterium]
MTSWLPAAATLLATLACFGMLAIAVVLSAFGISFTPGESAWAGTLCLLAVVATIGIAYNGARRRIVGPVVPAAAGAALVLADVLAGGGRTAEIAGFALIVLATLWDWRRRTRDAVGDDKTRWIEASELGRRLAERPPPLILDVRNPDEFAGELGHLERARNIPLAELPRRLAELGPDKERQWTIVCRTDMRSAKAAALLRAEGFRDVAVLRGGMLAWRQAEPRPAEPAGAAAQLTD